MSVHHDRVADELADQQGRLRTVLIITIMVLIAEVIGAAASGSLALLADAGHMLSDVAGLTLAWVASILARRPATLARTWGYRRAEVLAAVGQAAVRSTLERCGATVETSSVVRPGDSHRYVRYVARRVR